jgi:hypothetical protein
LAKSVKSALSGTADTVPVTVHVSPPNAVVFKNGQSLGTGEVTVNVAHGTKTTLVAQLLGYLPRTVVVDGTNKSVNIVLSRPESAPVTVARPAPAQKAAAFSTKSTEGASKNAETGAVPSDSTSASGSGPSKPSPPASAGTAESDPMSEVNPL